MKKFTKLLVLSGLAVSLLVGCNDNSGANKTTSGSESSAIVKALTSIKISAEPTKKSYRIGDEFDPAGLEVKAVYNTQEEEVVPASDYTLSGFDSQTAGPKTITVTYQEKTATFEVNVIGYNGLSITAPAKVRYFVGEDYDGTGLEVAIQFADGTSKPLAATEYTVDSSAFDKTKAGEYTITVTANGETGQFKVYVYNDDWSDDEKAFMTGFFDAEGNVNKEGGLIYEIPYFMGFELAVGGLKSQKDPEKYLANWFEARTDFAVDADDLENYCDDLEDIKVMVQAEDPETGEGLVDENGQPVMEEASAWKTYTFPSSKRVNTEDIEYLGFADDSEVYQYARWLKDAQGYLLFQVLSLGLDPNDQLLAVTTMCLLPYAGFYIDGQAYKAGQDLVNYFAGSIAEERAQLSFDATSVATFTDVLAFPTTDEDDTFFYSANAYFNPYLYCNYFAGSLFDTASCEFQFTRGKSKEQQFTADDLQALLDTMAKRGYAATPRTLQNGLTVYDIEINHNGYSYTATYYFIQGYICINVSVDGWEMPFMANHYLSVLGDAISDVADQYKLNFIENDYGMDYSEKENSAYCYWLIGLATSNGFKLGFTKTDEAMVLLGIQKSGLLTDEEFAALAAAYQQGKAFNIYSSMYAGTATIGEGDDAVNAQYTVTNNAGTKFSLVLGEDTYNAVFDPENTTLVITKKGDTDPTFSFAAADFTAAEGEDNDPFAGTWKNEALTLVLGNSALLIRGEKLTFACAPVGCEQMVIEVDLNVYGAYKYCDITVSSSYCKTTDVAAVKVLLSSLLANYLKVAELDAFPDFSFENAAAYALNDSYFDDSDDFNELDVNIYFASAEETTAAANAYVAALTAAEFKYDENTGLFTSKNGQYQINLGIYSNPLVLWIEFRFVQPAVWPTDDVADFLDGFNLTDELPAYEGATQYRVFDGYASYGVLYVMATLDANADQDAVIVSYGQTLVDAKFIYQGANNDGDPVYYSPNQQYSVSFYITSGTLYIGISVLG